MGKDTYGKNMTQKFPWLQWTEDEWADCLKEILERRKQVFKSDSDELIGSYNRERSYEKEYYGRALIELIQNADDAGVDFPGSNKILIKLTDRALFVANTGLPFSPTGVKSLVVSDISPKQLLKTKCIGYKGLGFRSVLGWASSIVILSGKLSIGFNEGMAAEWLLKLREENPEVDKKVREFKEKTGVPSPIPTLSVPCLLPPESVRGREFEQIYSEGEKLLEDGYDTVVCLLFKNPEKTLEKVLKQINSLGSEILLFLQKVNVFEIQSQKRSERWKVERKENEVCINLGKGNPKCWRLFRDFGDIPKEYLSDDQIRRSENKFEIKLAIPGNPVDFNRLFVYFPTEVLFPFPIIAHATFEVGAGRQHLVDSDANRFIAEKLAGLMAKSAKEIKNSNRPWHALRVVSPRGEIDPMLDKFEFLQILTEKIKAYAILPVRNGEFEFAKNTKRIEGNFDKLLAGELFHDICIYTDVPDLIKQLDNLYIDYIEYDELRERINRISNELNLEQRVMLVYLMIENNLIPEESPPPEILTDEDGNPIPPESTIFTPPERKPFSLPPWVPQRIVNSELASKLREKFGVTRNSELVSRLKPSFNVQEYRTPTLVSSIVAETNRRAKENPAEELNLRSQMVRAIWNLYLSTDEKVVLPDTITIILPTREGKFEPAKKLYFGKEYEKGSLLELLYAPIDPNLFVANPEELGFSHDSSPEKIEEFLCWLGVNDGPRYFMMNIEEGDFFDYAISSLEYPAQFDDVSVQNIEKLREYSWTMNVQSVDRLDEILEKSDPHAVICWMATNQEDIGRWRTQGDEKASFEIWPPRKQYGRELEHQSIPSYPLWLLATRKWLPIEGEGKQSPDKCTLARGIPKELSSIIGFPAFDSKHQLVKKLKLDKTAIKSALASVGVVTELNDLTWDSFYELLLELPKVNPDGSKAKSLYRTLISNKIEDSPSGERYEEFMVNGEMFGRMGREKKYCPIRKLYYLENLTLPSIIADHYPILELDPRSGASKVRKIFGIEQLTIDKTRTTIVDFEEHPCSQSFQEEVERLKPYIYAMRVEEDTTRRELKALRNLKVTLCKSVKATISVHGEEKEIELKGGNAVNTGSEAYLVADPRDYASPLKDVVISDAIGEIIANFLRVAGANDKITRLVSCSDDERDLLLNRITGGSGEERMSKAKECIETAIDVEVEFPKPEPWQPPALVEESKEPIGPGGEEGLEGDEEEGQAPTVEEILTQLPDFDDESYGEDKVVDLAPTDMGQPEDTEFRTSRGGSGGGGNLETIEAYQKAYGKRGEDWVVEQEKRALNKVGRPDLAKRVVHRSSKDEGSPWDIESFAKHPPCRPILIEVKSTPNPDNFTVHMSADQIKEALSSSRPYFIYRVVGVDTKTPRAYKYDFRQISDSKLLRFSATKVKVTLPRPQTS